MNIHYTRNQIHHFIMAKVKTVIFVFFIVALLGACELFDDFGEDIPAVFTIDFSEDETMIIASRNNTINIAVVSQSGVSSVELRQNFVTIEGSKQAFSGETAIIYPFEIAPEASEIGSIITYTVVAFDVNGYAINRNLQLTVQEPPETVTILLPPTAPVKINYLDSISFKVPFTSSTVLTEIIVKFEDSILIDKTSGFISEESDIIDFHYENFNVLAPGENRDFNFYFIGIAPLEGNESSLDTATVAYTVSVRGPRVPGPVDSYEDIEMGFQANNSATQFMDAETGNMYGYINEPFGSDNSELIDFAMYRSSSNKLCLTNPTDGGASEFIYLHETYGFAAWAKRNKTGFVKVVDESVFNKTDFLNTTSDEQFYEIYENAPVTGDTYKNLTTDDIVIFKTVNEKYGAILIGSYIDSSSGTVIFSMKIQQ